MKEYKSKVQDVPNKLGGWVRQLYSGVRCLSRDAHNLGREMLSSLSAYQEREQAISMHPGYGSNGYANTSSGHGRTQGYGATVSLGPGYPPRLPVGSKI